MLEIKINILQKSSTSESDIKELTHLINSVYEESESDFWPTDGSYSRTNTEEISNFILKGEMIAALVTDELVGSVHIYPINKTTLGFGMLTCSLNHRKKGIGNLLLKAVEEYALSNHYSKIQLELLKPIEFNHPEKEFLEKWYQKWGYQYYETIPYQKLYFKQATMLKFPCKFDLFQKELG